jgi:uncharacterized protein YijF (DUF1287 family)
MKSMQMTLRQILATLSLTTILFFTLISAVSPDAEAPAKQKVIAHAKWQTTQYVTYDGSYRRIPYPNGDVPANIGVCTDVIIRAYRAVGIDLQQLVHEDMVSNKAIYDKRRNTDKHDASIDHRRCPNLQTYFTRQNAKVEITENENDYKPGDVVFWNIAAGHVGMVVDEIVPGTNRYKVVHNIGGGPQLDDFLFGAIINGHYRWFPAL